MSRRLTRRAFITEATAAALVLHGCGGGEARRPAADGSTLRSTWRDPVGDGQLRVAPGEALVDRVELGTRAELGPELARIAHVTDSHVLDAASPARVTFLDRLGPPFQSTFRPQETLTAQVLAGTLAAIRRLAPQVVLQGGDLIDNAQSNELALALAILSGGRVRPGSGSGRYVGVQSADDADPFYYRPDLDAPRHPGLLRLAWEPFVSPGLGASGHHVLGDHDALVAGEIVPTPLTRSLAVGDRALWDLPAGLRPPPGFNRAAGGSPDGPLDPGLVDGLLRQALAGPTVAVPADARRQQMAFPEVLARLGAAGDRLDYVIDAGPQVRLIVLDLVRRGGGSGGLAAADQPAWLAGQIDAAGGRWVIVVSHQPLAGSVGGDALVAVLDRSPRVIAAVSGHTHRNRIEPRPSAGGGYWLISTASLIDFPQQARALSVHATAGGGVAIRTWMLDHVFPGGLGVVARQLAYLDAQGGRPSGLAGTRFDRNVTLFRRAA